MLYSFARVSAVVKDYYPQGKRSWRRLHEKGGKLHEVPSHHKAEEYLDAYLAAAELKGQPKTPLSRTTRGRTNLITGKGLSLVDAFRIVQRLCQNCRAAGSRLQSQLPGHRHHGLSGKRWFTGNSAHIAAHESPRTTKLYDRTTDNITLEEIERIRF